MRTGLIVVLSIFVVDTSFAEAPRFVRAYFEKKESVVRFESPHEIDWKDAARKYFKRFDPERPTEKDVTYLRGRIWEISGDAEETFRFPASANARRASYHLISAGGISSLNIAEFEGKIRFGFDPGLPPDRQTVRPKLVSTMYFGEAMSGPGQPGGGFVLTSPEGTPEIFAAVRAELTWEDGAHMVLNYIEADTRIATVLPRKWHHVGIDSAYGFQLAGRRYLFVDWPADTEGYSFSCGEGFSLYEVGTTLNEVASNYYDCDV